MVVGRTEVSGPLPARETPGSKVAATSAIVKSIPTSRNAPIRILRLAQVIEVTGLRKSKLYELQAAGQFPMRVQITAHTVGWVEEEVQAWLARRIASRSVLPGPSRAPRVAR